jgi:NADH-quinone oxidoreductase subunit A
MTEYIGILIFAFFAFALTSAFLVLTSVLGPKRPNPAKNQPFECGEKPFHLPASGVSIHFYLIAMLFIVFDVEIAFLFPWAVLFKKLGAAGLVQIGIFVIVILIGYVHAVKRGGLDPG